MSSVNTVSMVPKYNPEAMGVKLNGETIRPYPTEKTQKIYKEWEKKHEKGKTSKDFSKYVEKHASHSTKKDMKEHNVKYLEKKDEKKAHEVTFHAKKKFKIGDDRPEDGNYMFGLNSKGKMYAGEKEHGHFHHSSLLAGKPAKCAGMIPIKDGKIDKKKPIVLQSGHYRPGKEQGKNLKKYLEKELGKKEAKKIEIKEHKSHSGHKRKHKHK